MSAIRKPVEVLHPALIEAMQDAWNTFGADTGCFPECFSITRGPKLWADFDRSNWPLFVAQNLLAALLALPAADRAALARELAPEGWALVPREPTEAMMDAGLYQSSHDAEWADVHAAWKDMVDAALNELHSFPEAPRDA